MDSTRTIRWNEQRRSKNRTLGAAREVELGMEAKEQQPLGVTQSFILIF